MRKLLTVMYIILEKTLRRNKACDPICLGFIGDMIYA